MNTSEIIAINDAHVINTYGTRKIALVRGEGMALWDAEGNEYLDFFAGISVANLGHCHPAVTKAICDQAQTLIHVCNLYYIEPQVKLAELLCKHTFADRWFFGNSGAEANEAAIKIARRYWVQKGTPKPGIVTAQQSFHGRTLTTLAATGQPKLQEGFQPLPPGFSHVPYDSIDALADALHDDVGAIMLEPVEGEGGVQVPSSDYLNKVRELCNERNVLLILDEIQTGMGRTGTLFAHTQNGIQPDIMTTSKALGNGVPIGAMGCTEEVASGFSPGSHGSTFGGNPLCTAAALATLTEITKPGFLEHAREMGAHFESGLRALAEAGNGIVEVRAKGIMFGVELRAPAAPVLKAMTDSGIICGPAGPNVVRFLPPLIATREHADRVLSAFEQALGALA
ncbi:MAG: aspartate aminotransferase family protein [Candidatus Hydrogenedentes bacterium]|nr:aspartate aminotransferase family protein [Candidatus Hydrogenedentota bacterium]